MSGAVTLVDSDVLLDVVADDSRWAERSADALATAADSGPLVINPLIYAEVSLAFDRIEDLDDALPQTDITRVPLPWAAGFLAGKALEQHRRRGAPRSALLVDFYVGAHAAVDGLRLLTREPSLYRLYFPTVDIITPVTS